LNPLLDERPFKLRQRAEHMKEELALRSRGVHLLGERTKADAARLEIGHRRKQVRQGSSQPIQFPYNQAVAGLDEGERLGQACALAAVAAHPILEQVTFIDSGGKERVPLQIKSLAVAVGGNAHIADKHARKTVSDRFPHNAPFRQCLSIMFRRQIAPIFGVSAAATENTCLPSSVPNLQKDPKIPNGLI
jgi:hypothetical protein